MVTHHGTYLDWLCGPDWCMINIQAGIIRSCCTRWDPKNSFVGWFDY